MVTLVVSFAPLLIILTYDRYLLFLIPLCLLVGSLALPVSPFSQTMKRSNAARFATALSMVVTVLYFGFSVAGTHDYVSWNRARWKALRELLAQKIPPEEIDGGFEFNGWFLYDQGDPKEQNKTWRWVVNDTYVISFSPLHGYESIKSFPFHPWLPVKMNRVLVLKKEG